MLIAAVAAILAADPQLPRWHYVPSPHNWMNDPNGPFYDPIHKKYHLFAQYKTPREWSHAVSDDLLHWVNLPVALSTDEPYDKGGVYSGSATTLKNGTTILSYAVWTNDKQCLASPTNLSDPNFTEWTKYPGNPVITTATGAPPGRDPTTAWHSADGSLYRMAYGTTSGAVVFSSHDFIHWNETGYLHNSVSGQWECPDFFPLPNPAPNATHLLKASTKGRDYWLIGTYNDTTVKFTPQYSEMGELPSTLFDQGKYYASKSFWDPVKMRQVIFGWVAEERQVDDQGAPYGWASVQTLPRSITLDVSRMPYVIKTKPIEEMAGLRNASTHYTHAATQVQDTIVFPAPLAGVSLEIDMLVEGTCTLDIRVSSASTERTSIQIDSTQHTLSIDTTHSSLNETGSVTQAAIPNTQGAVQVQVYTDRSIIEVFVADSVTVMTRRIYPTKEDAVGVSISRSGTSCTLSKLDSWQLNDAM
eukprot:TRINITY_DN2916_c0_g1_i4.p1 TRINITY_DN2916_c0_g1~~TRINITY_DN2916_c0_g1_i4.p1  ORF type:complete len:473 (+),score=129.13 TRINITY_DN2916_c0_g1_i4:2102-3520(+)